MATGLLADDGHIDAQSSQHEQSSDAELSFCDAESWCPFMWVSCAFWATDSWFRAWPRSLTQGTTGLATDDKENASNSM